MKKLIKYILISILGLGALLVLAFLAEPLWDSTDREVHLIPSSYRGLVTITFEDSLAPSKEFDVDGARLYRLPSSGFLRTRHTKVEGWQSGVTFFFVDSLGTRTRIPWIGKPTPTVDSSQVGVYGYVVGIAGRRKLPFIRYEVVSLKNEQYDYREHPHSKLMDQ